MFEVPQLLVRVDLPGLVFVFCCELYDRDLAVACECSTNGEEAEHRALGDHERRRCDRRSKTVCGLFVWWKCNIQLPSVMLGLGVSILHLGGGDCIEC